MNAQYVIYDGVSNIVWPNFETYSPEDIAADKNYAMMLKEPFVLFQVDGITESYLSLRDMKRAYGVDEDDPQIALSKCIEAMAKYEEEAKEKVATLEELQKQNDEIMLAIAELGTVALGA